MRPVAAIDIGSNTVHLLVGLAKRDQTVEHLASESELLELGREVRKHERIRDKKLRQLQSVLQDQLKVARRMGAKVLLLGATGAMRRAKNGKSVVRQLTRNLEVPVQLLSSRAEAELAFRGSAPALDPDLPQVLIDSGGASTEVTLTRGRRRMESSSMGVGASLLCAELKHDPPGPLEWARLSLRLADGLRVLPTAPRPARAIAVGGAAHRIEELHGAGRGARVDLPDLERIARRLLRHPSHRIAEATGISRKKVVLLAAGALVIHAVVCHYGLESVEIGHQGLRDGMILAYRSDGGNWWRYRR